jgi:hypothetical protein
LRSYLPYDDGSKNRWFNEPVRAERSETGRCTRVLRAALKRGRSQVAQRRGDVRTGKAVELVDAEGVIIAGERVRTRTVLWTAGVSASPAGR